jgi:hypothetical protein
LLNSNGFVWILINIHWDSSVKYTTINKVRRPLSCLRLDKLDSSIHCAITTNTAIWKPGLRFGFLMHHNIAFVFKKWQLLFSSRLLLFSGYFLAIALPVTFGPFTAFHEDARPWTMSEKILYNTTRHLAWGIVLAWVTYACEYGYGGECGPLRCSPRPLLILRLCFI